MEWTLSHFAIATLSVASGALLQAATGLGAGLIVVPLLAMLSLSLVPGPMIFASLALSTTMAIAGRQQIDFEGFEPLLGGLLLGTVVAAATVAKLPLEKLGLLFGVMILLAVGLSLRQPRFNFSVGGCFGAGLLSGVMGTAAGIGAPVLALLYQHHSGPTLRATLALLYCLSSLMMLALLHWAGRFGQAELISGLTLVPGFVIGYLISPRLAGFIDQGYARPAVLILSSLSALLLIGRSLY
ncbi:sulfite exporter TauE/SafE family protein [Motiliproteus sp.]|uniref:sulfite exporter TauE/SafE family protein n=1 Tax=Motiliproteus sp. TaxID=1898955 RepID=UPI003BA8F43B